MADDVRVDNGDGPLVRAVEIGGKLYQAVILHDASGVPVGASANPVVVESSTPEVATPRTFDDEGNILTEVETFPNGTTRTWTYTYAARNPIPLTETYVDA